MDGDYCCLIENLRDSGPGFKFYVARGELLDILIRMLHLGRMVEDYAWLQGLPVAALVFGMPLDVMMLMMIMMMILLWMIASMTKKMQLMVTVIITIVCVVDGDVDGVLRSW